MQVQLAGFVTALVVTAFHSANPSYESLAKVDDLASLVPVPKALQMLLVKARATRATRPTRPMLAMRPTLAMHPMRVPRVLRCALRYALRYALRCALLAIRAAAVLTGGRLGCVPGAGHARAQEPRVVPR